MSTKTIEKEESLFQREKRLKSRKQTFKMSYKKGVYYNSWAYKNIIEYIKQENILIRVHNTGELNDGTCFINITIEGFTAKDGSI